MAFLQDPVLTKLNAIIIYFLIICVQHIHRLRNRETWAENSLWRGTMFSSGHPLCQVVRWGGEEMPERRVRPDEGQAKLQALLLLFCRGRTKRSDWEDCVHGGSTESPQLTLGPCPHSANHRHKEKIYQWRNESTTEKAGGRLRQYNPLEAKKNVSPGEDMTKCEAEEMPRAMRPQSKALDLAVRSQWWPSRGQLWCHLGAVGKSTLWGTQASCTPKFHP